MADQAIRSDVSSGENIRAIDPETMVWNSSDVAASLERVKRYAETAADRSASWYWRRKKWKARFSRAIQLGAMASTALAGLIPVVVTIFPALAPLFGGVANIGLAASVFVGFAAALIGLDRAFGLSSGWARYVLTATTIQKALEEFRMDWTMLLAKANSPPRQDELLTLIGRAKDFTTLIEGLVLQETKDWITEFQNNIAQLEKETKAQVDSLKTQTEKSIADQAAANQPGSVEIAVTNFDKIDGRTFDVIWATSAGPLVHETVSDAQEWVLINVSPGQYIATITARIGGKPTAKKCAITIGPGEQKKVDVLLPAVMAATP